MTLRSNVKKASVLIAQHGAALAIAILLDRRSTVLKISWSGFQESPQRTNLRVVVQEIGNKFMSMSSHKRVAFLQRKRLPL